jgi:hypothetical protein
MAVKGVEPIIVGKIYRLRFPGIAARVIEPPPGLAPPRFPFLVESLVLRSRWWVNELGEPDNIYSPLMKAPAARGLRPETRSAHRQPARWIRS